MSKLVIALGGNALQTKNSAPTAEAQLEVVKQTCEYVAELSAGGHELTVVHGNGPQVGMIQAAMTELTRSNPEKYIPCPLSVCVAMSQGYIGYDLQNSLREELLDR